MTSLFWVLTDLVSLRCQRKAIELGVTTVLFRSGDRSEVGGSDDRVGVAIAFAVTKLCLSSSDGDKGELGAACAELSFP